MAENTNYQFESIGHIKGVPVVRCCYKKNGCQWTDKVLYAEDHARSCIYKPITCKLCEKVIRKDQYNDHLLLYCKNNMFRIIDYLEGVAIYQCCNQESGCEWKGKGTLNEEHVYRCNYRSIGCTCCEEIILKGFYHDHLLLFCRNRMDASHCYEWRIDDPSLTPCPRSHLGCKWRGTLAMFTKQHAHQCNKQLKPCAACGKICMKGELCTHILNECQLRLKHVEGTFGNKVYTFNQQPPREKKH